MGHPQASQSGLRWFLGPGQLPLQSLRSHILSPGPQDGAGDSVRGAGVLLSLAQSVPVSPGATQRSGAQPASPRASPHHPSPPPGLRDWPGKNPRKEAHRGSQRPHPALRPTVRGARPSAWTPRISLCKNPNKHKTTNEAQASNSERGVDAREPGAGFVPGSASPRVWLQTRLCPVPWAGGLKHLIIYLTSN